MKLILSFIFSGSVCLIGQIILDNTKLTAGHITSLFTLFGVVLSFFNVYPWLIQKCGAGATILIMNFGNMLYLSAIEGYQKAKILGLFQNFLCKSSLAITSAVIFAFVFAIIFKPKN